MSTKEGLAMTKTIDEATKRPWIVEVHNFPGNSRTKRVALVSRGDDFETGYYVIAAEDMVIRQDQAVADFGLIVAAVNAYESNLALREALERTAAALHVGERHGDGLVIGPFRDCNNPICAAARAAITGTPSAEDVKDEKTTMAR